jgi:sulfite exporter TauE/SafE
MDISLAFAAVIGLLTSVHCAAMCGGIASAMSLGLPTEVRRDGNALFVYNLIFGFGRICSYALAGAVAATAFASVPMLMPNGGHRLLAVVAAIVLVMIGLHLAGWFPQLRRIEAFGGRWWQYLQKFRQRLLPIRSPLQAFGFGMIWVYSTLLWAAASGSPVRGAIYMTLFGFGTMPSVVAVGMAAARTSTFAALPRLRRAFGIVIIAVGLFSLQHNLRHGIIEFCIARGYIAAP